jgi:hypothetical protein
VRYLLLILLALSLLACGQNKDELIYQSELHKYVLSPNRSDSLCLNDKKRAQEDIANGKVVFTQEVGFGYGEIRYEEELKYLSEKAGLVYDIELFSDVEFEGQTQGCYALYMDNYISAKYGAKFKSQLHRKADSLFIENVIAGNKIVEYWDCDQRPRLPEESERTNDYIPSINVSELEIKENKTEYGGWPFIDLGFTINTDSTISNFKIGYFNAQLQENQKYQTELYNIAVKHIKENYPIWVPGTLWEMPVRTNNNVRIYFTKE